MAYLVPRGGLWEVVRGRGALGCYEAGQRYRTSPRGGRRWQTAYLIPAAGMDWELGDGQPDQQKRAHSAMNFASTKRGRHPNWTGG